MVFDESFWLLKLYEMRQVSMYHITYFSPLDRFLNY